MIFLRWLATAGMCLAAFIVYSYFIEWFINLIGGGKSNGK